MPASATMGAVEHDGELQFFVGQSLVISGIYVTELEAPLILAQWRQLARDTFVSDSTNAARLIEWLLDLKTTENAALIEQFRKLNGQLETLEDQIRIAERELDNLLYTLYRRSETERLMVEGDTRRRWDARMPVPPVQ